MNLIPQITAAILLASAISLTAQTVSMETPTSRSVGRTSFVAYLLANNDILAVVENMSCDSFFLTTDNGTIERDTTKRCYYKFRPERYSVDDTITYNFATIWYNKIVGKDTVRFAKKELWVEPWPFTALFGFEHGRSIIKKEKVFDARLTIEALNTGLSAFCPIVRFKVYAYRCSTLLYEKEFKNGWQVNQKTFASDLLMLETGDKLIFEDIYYTYFGGLELRADGIYLTVK